jgi:ribosomal protein S18 acetylase RimI-like enzyme
MTIRPATPDDIPAPIIRPATPDDIPAILGLLREGDDHHRPFDSAVRQDEPESIDPAFLLAAIEAPDELLLMAEAEGLAGFVRASLLDRPETRLRRPMRAAVIEELVVSAPARRQGHGRALMEAAQAWAREGGAQRISLGVFAANAGAIALYESLGYRVVTHTMVRDLPA